MTYDQVRAAVRSTAVDLTILVALSGNRPGQLESVSDAFMADALEAVECFKHFHSSRDPIITAVCGRRCMELAAQSRKRLEKVSSLICRGVI